MPRRERERYYNEGIKGLRSFFRMVVNILSGGRKWCRVGRAHRLFFGTGAISSRYVIPLGLSASYDAIASFGVGGHGPSYRLRAVRPDGRGDPNRRGGDVGRTFSFVLGSASATNDRDAMAQPHIHGESRAGTHDLRSPIACAPHTLALGRSIEAECIVRATCGLKVSETV